MYMFFFGRLIFEIFTVKLAACAECTEFVAFEFDVIWAGGFGCVNCLNIHDSRTCWHSSEFAIIVVTRPTN